MVAILIILGTAITVAVVATIVDTVVRLEDEKEEAKLLRRIHGGADRYPLLEAMRGIPEPPAPGTPVNLTQVMVDVHNAHIVSGEHRRLASKGERCCHVETVSFIDHEDGVRPILRPEVNTGRKKRWKP